MTAVIIYMLSLGMLTKFIDIDFDTHICSEECEEAITDEFFRHAMRKKYWNEMTQKQIKTIPARQRKNAATWIGRFFSLRISVL